jgi:hypothetical protein
LKRTIAHGTPDPVVCRLGNLRKGTPVTLQSRRAGQWLTLAKAKSAGPVWAFGQVFPDKGPVLVRLSVGASKDFAAVVTAPVKVTVT